MTAASNEVYDNGIVCTHCSCCIAAVGDQEASPPLQIDIEESEVWNE